VLALAVGEGEAVDVGTLVVRALTDVRGTIEGLPPDTSDAALQLVDAHGEHERIAPLPDGGRFTFLQVPAGEYSVRLHDGGVVETGPHFRVPAPELRLPYRSFVPVGAR
jgi:hypothetical protein